jgi:hypothetical protein
MEIDEFNLPKLRNNEHFEFQKEFKGLVEEHIPDELKALPFFAAYLTAYDKENFTLNVVQKSIHSGPLVEADDGRDTTFRGMCDAVESATRHFRPEVREAASRVKVLLGHYGNLAQEPLNEESAKIGTLIDDLNNDFAEDVATLGLTEWLVQLKADNDAFKALVGARYTEETLKPETQMKQVRLEVDEAYRKIAKRINALVEVEGEDAYKTFVNELNKRIEKYSDIVAQRRGRKQAEKEPETE